MNEPLSGARSKAPRPHGLLSLCAALIVHGTMAQSGPGGVGGSTSNFLWLDAGHGITASPGISQWQDRSGNGNHANQATALRQPNVFNNSMNGRRTVEFDNDATNYDFLVVPDNSTLEGMSGLTGFVVYRLNTGTAAAIPRCFFSKRDGVDLQEAYDWFIWNSGTSIVQHLDIDNTSHRASATNPISAGVNYINAFTYHGALPSDANDQILYNGNTVVGNRAEGSTSIPNYTSHLYIGTLQGHSGGTNGASRFNGSIGEIILYNQTLNDAQRIIVTNYLSAKFDIALASADVYRMDEPTNGNYDHDVAGIGRTNSTNIHADARGTGILRINNPTGLGDNEFLVWGHDNGLVGTWASTDVPSGVEGRWARTWRCSELNMTGTAVDVGAVDLTFDLNGLGPITTSDIRLLVDTDNDGVFADQTAIGPPVAVGGGLYRFSGVTALTNSVRFTLASINIHATPLPVELLYFTAEANDRSVDFQWATATEQNNDRFEVQRSRDLTAWATIAQVPGAGNSSAERQYSAEDPGPLPGQNYYRLQQVDHDGTATPSPVVAVLARPRTDLLLVPNPAHGEVVVHHVPAEGVSLHDALGREIPLQQHQAQDGRLRIPLDHLVPGVYFVVAGDAARTVRRLVVQ